jgi:chromosome segregation protein
MFRFLEFEIHGWDFWESFRVPLDANIVVLSGPNGSGKTTILDAIRQVLHAPRLSQNRRISHYLRTPNQPALLRAVVSNRPDYRGRRPFERQQVLVDEATLACVLIPNGGSPDKRYAVLPGRVTASELQNRLLETRDWLSPEEYRRVLEHAGVSRSLMHILALEQGRADELSRQRPRELFRWVMEARGTQQVLERYTEARRQYEDSIREIARQRDQVARYEQELMTVDRKVRRLDEYLDRTERVKNAEEIHVAARLQTLLAQFRDIERKLPDLRTKTENLATSTDRLTREILAGQENLSGVAADIERHRVRYKEAAAECDLAVRSHERLVADAEVLRGNTAELALLPPEDSPQLGQELAAARAAHFSAAAGVSAVSQERERAKALVKDLEQGIRHFPDAVEKTLSALGDAGIDVTVVAEHTEITDANWSAALESALGPLRYAICVQAEEVGRATAIAHSFNFLGPIIPRVEAISQSTTAGPLRLAAGVPKWLGAWGEAAELTREDPLPIGDCVIAADGTRRDRYGIWVSQAPDYVLGGQGLREQLQSAGATLVRLARELSTCELTAAHTEDRVADLEERLEKQRRRNKLIAAISRLPRVEQELSAAAIRVDECRKDREIENTEVISAQNEFNRAEEALRRKKDDQQTRDKEIQSTRLTIDELDATRAQIEPEINTSKSQISSLLVAKAEATDLPSVEMALRDVQIAKDDLIAFEHEGPIPDETVREEKRLLTRNIEDLLQHVCTRQDEADAAKSELEKCREDYLEVIRSTLHDYAKRARSLAELASARIEIELPQLENTDRSIDEAGIAVRIGFDGKPPSEIGDTAHSGGQQVIAGLVLLMSMAEIEGDSFFIVDEPFAHLSLDRVDDVGKFLRRSGAQFLITVPTTLDRGQLDPASLVVILRKKIPAEAFAPSPLVARA